MDLGLYFFLEQLALPCIREERVSSIKLLSATRQNIYTNSKEALIRVAECGFRCVPVLCGAQSMKSHK